MKRRISKHKKLKLKQDTAMFRFSANLPFTTAKQTDRLLFYKEMAEKGGKNSENVHILVCTHWYSLVFSKTIVLTFNLQCLGVCFLRGKLKTNQQISFASPHKIALTKHTAHGEESIPTKWEYTLSRQSTVVLRSSEMVTRTPDLSLIPGNLHVATRFTE